jgi:hypothetical protein
LPPIGSRSRKSFSQAPDGSLFIGSASKPLIDHAAKGASEAKVFIDVSTAERNVSFLGILADGATTGADIVSDGIAPVVIVRPERRELAVDQTGPRSNRA